MRCPSCRHENRETARFCEDCATPFTPACPSCGTELRPAARFCDECAAPVAGPARSAVSQREPRSYTPKHLAEKILTSRSALEGERKQVSVLFADVQGSLALSERVDPETLHRIMDRFFVILAEGVHRFEGTVNQYTGDGIMALFGAPIAHEDHARRACYAALHLRDELRRYADELRLNQGLNFSVRMGLNSGEVVVGKIGDDLRMDYTAQGHTVGLAARMEQLAEAGHAYLAQETARLVQGFFRLRDLGPLAVKGAQDPLRVYEIEGIGPLRTRLDVSRARGFSKFVGRAPETAALEAALERAIEGNGQVIGVVGEAGVGKSRLCYEFVQGCRARGVMVNEAHGVAHGKRIPFLPVLEFFRGYFGITDQDGDEMARDKIAGRLLRLDAHFSETLPLVFDFLGVPDPARPVPRMDPEARQRQLFGVTRRLVHARSQREPAVVLLEDLHWIDGGSEGFVASLVEALPGTRTLVVVNFRPEYRSSWMQQSSYQQLPLLPLGSEAITELLRELLGGDPSLADLADRIRARTGGNPFFLEEVVHSLVEAGHLEGSTGAYRLANPVDEVTIPPSVHAVLAARIDRLGEQQKQVLQTASVIGRSFSEAVLKVAEGCPEAELAASLSSLERAEFVYAEALYPEAVYTFKHALTQEVAYRSQLAERRAGVHAAVARTITELYPDKLDEQAAVIAHHWEGAGETLEAARWHSRAAEWAGANHPDEAISHWRRVHGLLATTPESPDSLRLGATACMRILMQGWRAGLSDEETARLFEEGKALASRCGDRRLLALLHCGYGAVNGFAGALGIYRHHVLEAVRLAEEANDEELRFVLSGPLAMTCYLTGDAREALRVVEHASVPAGGSGTLGADVVGYDLRILLPWFKGYLLMPMGRVKEGEDAMIRAVEAARLHADPQALVLALLGRVTCARLRGDGYTEVGRYAAQAVEIAERNGGTLERVLARAGLGTAHLLTEEWRPALSLLEQALVIARECRTGLDEEGYLLARLATAQLGLGDTEQARESAEEAVAVARRQGNNGDECLALLAWARVVLRVEGPAASDKVRAALGRAKMLVEESGQRSHEPFIHEELANLAGLDGDDATRERELREAHRLFGEMGATGHAQRLGQELGL